MKIILAKVDIWISMVGHGNTDWGDPIYASGSGTIIDAGYEAGGYGNYVTLESGGVTFRFAHLALVYVLRGQSVSRGDLIGLMGRTGDSSAVHLHWEAWLTNEGPNSTTFNIFDIPGVDVDEDSLPCSGDNDGSIFGNNVGNATWMNCTEYHSQPHVGVLLFDHDDCKGNTGFVDAHADGSPRGYNLADHGWNDRLRSIAIPNGMSVFMSAHVPGTDPEILTHCHNETMYFIDNDHYDQNPTISIGWDSEYLHGYNMVSWITVYRVPNCGSTDYITSSDPQPQVGSYDSSPDNQAGQTGTDGQENQGVNSYGVADGDTITIHDYVNFGGTHYGYHEPLTRNVPDYIQNWIGSIGITPGWSALVAEYPDLGRGRACFSASDNDLRDNSFHNGAPVNDNIDSIQVFQNTNCGGNWLPITPTNIPTTTSTATIMPTAVVVTITPTPTRTSTPTVIATTTPTPEPVSQPAEPKHYQVEIYEHANCTGWWLGWNTTGLFNISTVRNNQASCVILPDGMSVMIFEGSRGRGGKICLSQSARNLTQIELDSRLNANDVVSSIEIFNSQNCGQVDEQPQQPVQPVVPVTPENPASQEESQPEIPEPEASESEEPQSEEEIRSTYTPTPTTTPTRMPIQAFSVRVFEFPNRGGIQIRIQPPSTTRTIPESGLRGNVGSIEINPGNSVAVYHDPELQGERLCLTQTVLDLSTVHYQNGESLLNNIGSIQAVGNTNCEY